MTFQGLDKQQGYALVEEMTSTRNLLAYGIRVVRTAAFIDTTRDPILTMLSIGLEKLYKLTTGLIALDTNGAWPTSAEMRKRGHGIASMHELVIGELKARTREKSAYVRELISEIENDPVVDPVVRALDSYGRSGRFYFLDELGQAPQDIHPAETWHDIERAALADDRVAALFRTAFEHVGDNRAWTDFNLALNARIGDAIEGLWLAVADSGRNHALGQVGTVFGFEVHPSAVGRQ